MKTLKDLVQNWVLDYTYCTFGSISEWCRKKFPYTITDEDVNRVINMLIEEGIIEKCLNDEYYKGTKKGYELKLSLDN